jgi:hypothetical protein
MTYAKATILHRATVLLVAALALIWTGCDSTGVSPDDTPSAPVTLSFMATPAGGSGTLSSKAAKSRTYSDDAGNALTIESVEIILREIEFERADADEACLNGDDDGDGSDDDDCEEVEQGPILVDLPLDSNQPTVALEATLPEGLWKEVEFDVHKLERDDDDDAAFLDETGFPEGVSIRVTGTWTPAGGDAQAFTYVSDLNEEQEIEFDTPIEVTAEEAKNVTFEVDVDRWFRTSDGTLVNPAEGNDDGRYEDLIEENIENSIEGFEDDDRDGDDDDDEDDDDDD